MNTHTVATAEAPHLSDTGNYLDSDGYLKDPSLWNWDMAQAVANKEKVGVLTGKHRRVIKYVRRYYKAHEDWPVARQIKKDIGCSNPCSLFLSPPETIFKVAGLPNPGGREKWGTRRFEICP